MRPFGSSGVEPIEGLDLDLIEACLTQCGTEPPAKKCGLVRRISHLFLQPENIFLEHNQWIQHVRLSKAEGTAWFQEVVYARESLLYLQVVDNR